MADERVADAPEVAMLKYLQVHYQASRADGHVGSESRTMHHSDLMSQEASSFTAAPSHAGIQPFSAYSPHFPRPPPGLEQSVFNMRPSVEKPYDVTPPMPSEL